MPKRQRQAPQIDFQGYIEVRFDEDQKKLFKKWASEFSDLASSIDKQVEAGYRFSLSWDDYNSAYMCSITTKDSQSVNAGWVLVGRGKDVFSALLQAYYKHVVVTQENWTNHKQTRTQDWD